MCERPLERWRALPDCLIRQLVRRVWVRWVFLAAVGLCILVSLCGSVMTCAAGLMVRSRFTMRKAGRSHRELALSDVASSSRKYLNETIERLFPFDYNDGIAMWLWSAAICDVFISACLAFTLRQRIQGFRVQTDSLLRRLIQTALLTASYTAFLAVTGGAWRPLVQVAPLIPTPDPSVQRRSRQVLPILRSTSPLCIGRFGVSCLSKPVEKRPMRLSQAYRN